MRYCLLTIKKLNDKLNCFKQSPQNTASLLFPYHLDIQLSYCPNLQNKHEWWIYLNFRSNSKEQKDEMKVINLVMALTFLCYVIHKNILIYFSTQHENIITVVKRLLEWEVLN